jgi:lipopolysaccharide export system protein LptA
VRPALRVSIAFALLATAIAPRTLADPPKPAPPRDSIHLSADRLEIDLDGKSATFTGNVRLDRGDLTVRSPRIEVRYDAVPNVTWARGTGGVIAEMKGVRAEAPEVELDLPRSVLTLRGGVRVSRGAGWISAERATLDLLTSKISLTDVKGALPVPPAPSAAPAP